MQFNSLIFLFLFLPVFLFIYFVVDPRFKNYFLLAAGLFFYAWGHKEAVFILIFLILINYFLSLRMSEAKDQKHSKRIFVTGIIINILILVFYKYLTFLLKIVGVDFQLKGIPYPTGISFMTFLGISYLTDIYRKSVEFKRGLADYALYVSLFPKLITGPITVYSSFKHQLKKRDISLENFSYGIKRFITGLGKKVLFADTFAETANTIFSIPADKLSSPLSWIGIIAYALQIYYDFSGYSDMAIGLGRMIGFKIPENFNYPYKADSIKNFWERWHITLGLWLKIYLFLPIAYGVMRWTDRDRILRIKIENWAYLTGIFITFTICGLWHGAAWTFILWGSYYGILLGIEHLGVRKKFKKKIPLIARIVITQFFVLMGWVLFRSMDIGYSYQYMKAMFGFAEGEGIAIRAGYFLNNEFLFVSIVGIIFSFPLFSLFGKIRAMLLLKYEDSGGFISSTIGGGFLFVENLFYISVFVFSIMVINSGSYQPFIYFRF